MEKTAEDVEEFARLYNEAAEEGRKELQYTIPARSPEARPIERTFEVRTFKIEPSTESAVRALLKGENELTARLGYPFCPCKVERSNKNVCPCKDCLNEIERDGRCHCGMYLLDGAVSLIS
jgi:ferredoxin-thioredoxin reductase catalytic subunit